MSEVHGVLLLDDAFAVRAPAPLLAALAAVLPPVQVGAAARRVDVRGLDVVVEGGATRTASDPAQLLAELAAALNAEAIASCRDLAVHAGVVALGDRAVAFPAMSGAGKSTLTAACLRAGLDYVSDEALVLSDAGTVRPYPRPLALDGASLALLGLPAAGAAERLLTAADLDATTSSSPGLRLTHVVLLERRPGPPALTGLPRGEGAAALLRMAFNHYLDPQRALRVVAAAAGASRSWSLRLDRPDEAAAVLRALLEETG